MRNTINSNKTHYGLPFYFVLIFLFFEYGRPQGLLPVIGTLRIGMIIQLLLLLFLIKKKNSFNMKPIQSKCFIGLILLMTLHVPFATNNYWAFMKWYTTVLYFIVFLSIINFVDSFSKIKLYIIAWIMVNLFCAIIGIMNGGRVPNSGFMGDENDFALVMNMAIPFAYFMFLSAASLKYKLLYISAVGVFISSAIVSLSRGGFVGLVGVGIFCWLKTPKKILATFLIAIMIGLVTFVATDEFWKEVRSIQEENIQSGTGRGRWYLWTCAWNMFLDNPIVGVGQDNFRWNVGRYEPSDKSRGHGSQAVHSLYFTVLPELGIIGVIFFSCMVYGFYKNNRLIKSLNKNILIAGGSHAKITEEKTELLSELKQLPFITNAINGALIGYLTSGIFISVFYYPHFWVLTAINTAMGIVLKEGSIIKITWLFDRLQITTKL